MCKCFLFIVKPCGFFNSESVFFDYVFPVHGSASSDIAAISLTFSYVEHFASIGFAMDVYVESCFSHAVVPK